MSGTKEITKTIGEVEKLTGIPKRKLKYMIERDLMRPSQRSEAGFWLYDEKDIQNARTISLLQWLDYSEESIRTLLTAPASQWPEALERQIARLADERNRIEDQLFLAEVLRHRNRIQADAAAFSPSGDGIPLAWEPGKKHALCRFLCQLFSEAEPGTQLHELSHLANRPPDDPAVQEQIHRLCELLWQSRALSTAQLLLVLRLAGTLSGLAPALDALLHTEGAVRFLTAALQSYCDHQQTNL